MQSVTLQSGIADGAVVATLTGKFKAFVGQHLHPQTVYNHLKRLVAQVSAPDACVITQVEAEVAARIYAVLPAILKLIIPERVISALIESSPKYAKEVWAKNDKIAAVAKTNE